MSLLDLRAVARPQPPVKAAPLRAVPAEYVRYVAYLLGIRGTVRGLVGTGQIVRFTVGRQDFVRLDDFLRLAPKPIDPLARGLADDAVVALGGAR